MPASSHLDVRSVDSSRLNLKSVSECCFKCITSFSLHNRLLSTYQYFYFMKQVTEAQRDIYDLFKSPQPGSSRAAAENPFLQLSVLFFSLAEKVRQMFQITQLRHQVGLGVGGGAGGMQHLGKVSEKPGSLKMSPQRQGGGRRTAVGTECARLWRWEGAGHKWRWYGSWSHRSRK